MPKEVYGLPSLYQRVFVADARTFEFDYYDVIICGDVLEHMDEDDGIRLVERLYDRCDELEMSPRGDLRHNPAVARVKVRLRRDHGGEHLPLERHDGRRSLVARGLDPENQRPTGSFHMISASSRLSV